MNQLQQEFEDEVHNFNIGLAPGMSAYINWLEAKVEKLTNTNKQSESLLCAWYDECGNRGVKCAVCAHNPNYHEYLA